MYSFLNLVLFVPPNKSMISLKEWYWVSSATIKSLICDELGTNLGQAWDRAHIKQQNKLHLHEFRLFYELWFCPMFLIPGMQNQWEARTEVFSCSFGGGVVEFVYYLANSVIFSSSCRKRGM